jgi:hypothetical protein
MQAYGARITDVPSDNKRITAQPIKQMIATAQEISAQAGHWWCDQLNNADGESGYGPLGEEAWQQAEGSIDAFVHTVSTAHSIHGTAAALRRHNPRLHVTAVEPAESPVLSGGPSVRTRSKESVSALCRRSGSAARSMRSPLSAPLTPRPWQDASPGKKRFCRHFDRCEHGGRAAFAERLGLAPPCSRSSSIRGCAI